MSRERKLHLFDGDEAFRTFAKSQGHQLLQPANRVVVSDKHYSNFVAAAAQQNLKFELLSSRTFGSEKLLLQEMYASDPHCHYCGILTFLDISPKHKQRATYDHKVPVINGGKTNKKNGLLACNYCNHLKSSMSYEEFLEHKPWIPDSPYWEMVRKRQLERKKLKAARNIITFAMRYGNKYPEKLRLAVIGILFHKVRHKHPALQKYREIEIEQA